jgi:tetratricopeptide (TPR) repeat protein
MPPRPAPPADRIGKETRKEDWKHVATMDVLSLLVLLPVQAPGLPSTGPNVREAEKLADEILAQGDKASFDARAMALAVKGLYTRAVNTYLAGLRDKGLLAPGYANGLLELIDKHPALSRPESLTVPDPLAGEKAYATGLNFFAQKKYVDAEREFLSAIENDNGDARYFYYLGLTRLALGKRDAYEDLDAAARLERLGRPGSAAVSRALERVQGPMRKVLNDIRNRPVKDQSK